MRIPTYEFEGDTNIYHMTQSGRVWLKEVTSVWNCTSMELKVRDNREEEGLSTETIAHGKWSLLLYKLLLSVSHYYCLNMNNE